MSTARRILIAVAVVLAIASTADAHRGSITYAHVQVRPDVVGYDIELLARDLAEPLGLPRETVPTRAQAGAGIERIAKYLTERIAILNYGEPCNATLLRNAYVDKTDGYALRLQFRYTCARRPAAIEVRYHLFFDIDPRHECFTTIDVDGALRQHIFRQGQRTLVVAREVGAWEHVRDYLILGIEHIFTGYDHICFLIALLLVAGQDGRTQKPRGLRKGLVYTLTIVTAFTVAHSITLIVAALGIVQLSSRLVESAIALSIAFVAAENLLVREPRSRWLLTFGFGLVHGFGFASVLQEIGLPARGLILSLLSFNVGVEIGQAVIVIALFPLLHVLARSRLYRPIALRGGSTIILLLGLMWFFQRVF